MNILLISQCSKNALTETRRVLDQFAERKGDRVWQTAITQQGLTTLRKLLRKSARRNTAVACHWIRGANRTELIWIVGSLRRFNDQGSVPTQTTARDILRRDDENAYHSAGVITLLAAIAGLFHDFGKANVLFQKKLKPSKSGKKYEPYRHEWVSLRLFQAFVGDHTDQQWLQALMQVDAGTEQAVLQRLIRDEPDKPVDNPLHGLPDVAKVVGWLIVTHHRLPVCANKLVKEKKAPLLQYLDRWFTESFNASWNSPQIVEHDQWSSEDLQANWSFPKGTPLRSKTWQAKARQLAQRALKLPKLAEQDWFEQRFTLHLSRLVLMWADHYYSSQDSQSRWQDRSYIVFANTDRQTKKLKQQLDEHNIGVGQQAYLIGRQLPKFRSILPALGVHKGFTQRNKKKQYRWQDNAYERACSIREQTAQQGFFGINMASTGCGKTFANARIMYGLSDSQRGCRFSIALGLRTLTLQTGDALRAKLQLQEDELAVLIGSQAVKALHEHMQNSDDKPLISSGSESQEALLPEHFYVHYEGSLETGRLKEWLKTDPKLLKLLSAPLLVSTIDHLVPATDGLRGGKQIAPMLRLLTSDLVLDEPDDFDLADLPALCRLVNWAGVLGSRVLISSATLPLALLTALFEAYQQGWADFKQVNGEPNPGDSICCLWVDEFATTQHTIANRADFKTQHQAFVDKRVEELEKQSALRKAELVSISSTRDKAAALQAIAGIVQKSMIKLHTHHHQAHNNGQNVSLGLVRMANINPLVAVAKNLLQLPAPEHYRIHYCIYHSQYPLVLRSKIEQKLDAALTRYDSEQIWQQPEIQTAIAQYDEPNHIFVVLATSVAEVGRDHDYDWAIAEPSSMRSLIQLAGRIQRHRKNPPEQPNLFILVQNYKALIGQEIAYCKPGFETINHGLASHDLRQLLRPKQYQHISAIPRIVQPKLMVQKKYDDFVLLEHVQLAMTVFQKPNSKIQDCADLWWIYPITWHGELQRRQPFRKSEPEQHYALYLEEEGDTPQFVQFDDRFIPKPSADIANETIQPAKGNQFWLQMEPEAIYYLLAEQFDKSLADFSKQFGELRLRDNKSQTDGWLYHPNLGVYQAI